ncbi:MAG: mechanosensitive ion channel family protein [Fusobacteriaceae bacterium]
MAEAVQDVTLISEIINLFKNQDVGKLALDFVFKGLFRTGIAVLIFVISKRIIDTVARKIVEFENRKKMDKSLIAFISSMFKVFSYAVIFMIILRVFGISETSIAAVFGAAGVGAGFAIKDVLANFSGGVIILVFKPYKIGDFIEVGDKTGEVESISIFSTELNTIDNKKVFVPNGGIVMNHITNYSANKVRRVEIIFGIAYSDDFRKAIEILNTIADSHEKILHTVGKTIRVKELGNSSVNILYRVWCKNEDYWTVHFDSTEMAKEAFDRVGITIPFPQMDVHLVEEKDEKDSDVYNQK